MKKGNFFGYDIYSFGSGELRVSVTTLGAAVTGLNYMGHELVLNYPDAEGYINGSAYLCAAVGRYANRIGGAKFTLNGKEYVLPANEGKTSCTAALIHMISAAGTQRCSASAQCASRSFHLTGTTASPEI